MSSLVDFAALLVRQDAADPTSITEPVEEAGGCEPGNEYDGRLGVRISAIFVILVGSLFGAWFPVFARRHQSVGVPESAFFIAKYFGSGVIIATAFIHLLAPANEALLNPCLEGETIAAYPWVEGIALMTIMVMFFIELMVMRYAKFGTGDAHAHGATPITHPQKEDDNDNNGAADSSSVPGTDHLGHEHSHVANSEIDSSWEAKGLIPESYSAQLTAIFILEFGVIFHSVFIGLTLAVAGSEFTTLYIVLVFHQTFEGLGLGSRLATVPWPKSKRWTPYLLAAGYGISTPIAIAIGLGVRESYPPEGRTTLIVNGVFDSISAGILIYTGLIELMAHEFMFSPSMARAPIKKVLSAMLLMYLGAALMALLGKWA
ncbi:ZIP zinc/iron transport family [Pseudovirgaria hyperparasitica]|uniref:ZIP zinc/iron transport family n=1 Tax=Pseudovirgaria hyperparasitica TaxID=470096 RepID=A0A6A6VXS7_9PEZI|nr:ZIP zinc/iron transport family [Pseudovirgaria hyperparasitica]KAF2755412.1 ZIP zinc/iron transport family [Pseudovirgaria hyperparasitica]